MAAAVTTDLVQFNVLVHKETNGFWDTNRRVEEMDAGT